MSKVTSLSLAQVTQRLTQFLDSERISIAQHSCCTLSLSPKHRRLQQKRSWVMRAESIFFDAHAAIYVQ